MSFGLSGSWVLLDGARLPAALSHTGVPLQRAGGILQAAVHLSRRPSLLVADPSLSWHATFLRTLPAQGRPPILAVSEHAPPPGLADAWLRPDAPEDECRRVLQRLQPFRPRPRPHLSPQTARSAA